MQVYIQVLEVPVIAQSTGALALFILTSPSMKLAFLGI